jgi:hypothetical protein
MRLRKVAAAGMAAGEEVANRLALVEEALRAQQVDGPMSSNAAALATSTADVLQALGGRAGVVWLDRLVIVKESDAEGGRVKTVALSAEQVRKLRAIGAESWQPEDWFGKLPAADPTTSLTMREQAGLALGIDRTT